MWCTLALIDTVESGLSSQTSNSVWLNLMPSSSFRTSSASILLCSRYRHREAHSPSDNQPPQLHLPHVHPRQSPSLATFVTWEFPESFPLISISTTIAPFRSSPPTTASWTTGKATSPLCMCTDGLFKLLTCSCHVVVWKSFNGFPLPAG